MRVEFKGNSKGFLLPVKTTKDSVFSTGVAFQNSSNLPLFTYEQGSGKDVWVKFDIKQADGVTSVPDFSFTIGEHDVRSGRNGKAIKCNGAESRDLTLVDGVNTVLIKYTYTGGSWTHKVTVWINGDTVLSDVRVDVLRGTQNCFLLSADKNVWFSNIIVSDEMIGFDEVAGASDSAESGEKAKGCYLTAEELEPYQNIMDELSIEDAQMASSLIDGYLGRSFELTQFTDRVRLRKNRGKLTHSPVAKVEKVIGVSRTMFGKCKSELPPEVIDLDPEMDGYFTFENDGSSLTAMVFNNVPETLLVTYDSGFEKYPQRLKDACGMLACNIRQAKSFAGAKQLSSLDFQVLMTDDSFFTSDIKMLLKGLEHDVRNV